MLSRYFNQTKMPDEYWWKDIEACRPKHTPDVPRLETKSHWLVFATGETMRSGSDHNVMEDYEFQGHAFTKNYFQHWKRKLGESSFDIPLIADKPTKQNGPFLSEISVLPYTARIKGELYLVPTQKIITELDKYNENVVAFERKRVQLLFPWRGRFFVKERSTLEKKLNRPLDNSVIMQRGVQYLKAWMYIGKPDFWEPQLDGGFNFSPVRVFKPRKNLVGNYSYFSRKEYEDI